MLLLIAKQIKYINLHLESVNQGCPNGNQQSHLLWTVK